jgi:class 3 adenylate cyclase
MLEFDFNIAIVLLFASFLTESILAAHIFYRFPRNLQNTVFISLLLISAYWSIIYLLEIAFRSNGAEIRLAIIKFEIFGWIGVPYLLALFFLIYSPLYRKKLLYFVVPVSLIVPIVSITGLMLNTVEGGFVYVRVEALSDVKNVGFTILMAFNYVMTVAGMLLAGIRIFNPSNKEAIKKKIAILIGIFIPLIGNVVKNVVFPIVHIEFEYDPTPISFAIAYAFFMYGIFGLKILNILPRAMQDLFNQMNEGVIILSKDLSILRANKYALSVFMAAAFEGDKITKLLGNFEPGENDEEGIERIKRYFNTDEKTLEHCKTIYIREGEERLIFYVNITWITNKKQKKLGYLIIFHDYTQEAILEEEISEKSRKLKETFERLNPGVSEIITSRKMMMGEVCVTNHFCDVAGYTIIEMILGDKLAQSLMQDFYTDSHIIITKYRGYRDKIIGDQIRSIFGIRKDDCQPSKIHPFDAIFTAMRINDLARSISGKIPILIKSNRDSVEKKRKEYIEATGIDFDIDNWPFTLRHGISTSKEKPAREIDRVTMTMMGDESGWDYTSQGGSIILSARLESMSNPSEISISENTNELVKRFYRTEKCSNVYLKNLGNYPYYKLLGLKTLSTDYFPGRVIQIVKQWEKKINDARIKIRIGSTQFYEISKVVEWVDIDLEYLEHLKGVMNIGTFRAYWAIALADLLGISKDVAMISAILDPVDYRDFPSLNIKRRYKLDNQVPASVGMDRVKKILEQSNMSDRGNLANGDRLVSEVIRFSRLFDRLTFDHTYLDENKNGVLDLGEALRKLEKSEKWEPAVIESMKKLL